jgi:PAS domain S-box-containing protein
MWEKIVLNLLSNAFKFTFEGGIEVRLRREGECAVLGVRDSGIGIAPEAMPRLFERFHRIEGARSRTHEGSGIGLALVQELVRMHGGEIRVDSQPGQGSAFVVSLPLGSSHLPKDQVVEATAEGAAIRQAPMFVHEVLGWLQAPSTPGVLPDVTPGPFAGERERILVAEDNADMREYIERLLSESWDVVAVADGEEAIQALFTARFDLLLTDVMMPRVDGFALLEAVRSDRALRELPIIMLSARAGEEARIEGRAAGADDYLVKPFSARELVAQVKAQLAVAAARRARTRERELLLASERAARMDAQRQWEDLVRLFEQAPNPMVILRGQDHVIELANPAACRVWGRTVEEVLHRPLFDALPEARGQGLESLLESVLATGEPSRGRRLAVRLDRGAGLEAVYFDFVYSPLRAASGRIEGVAVAAFDVTEQVVAREELTEAP